MPPRRERVDALGLPGSWTWSGGLGFGSGATNANFNFRLVLSSNGTANFSGTYNDTGSIPIFQSPAQNWVVVAALPAGTKLLTFSATGNTPSAQSTTWNTSSSNQQIALAWPLIVGGTVNYSVSDTSDLGGILNDIDQAAAGVMTILPKHIDRAEPLHLLIDSTGLKIYGEGEWLDQKHGTRSHRQWRKLHIGMDAGTHKIGTAQLTTDDVGDVSEIPHLLDQIDADVASMTADGAYDGDTVYDAVIERDPEAAVIIPPRVTAVTGGTTSAQRDHHIATIAKHGRMGWQRRSGYNRRSLIETAMFRYKTIVGRRLHARILPNQRTGSKIGCNILNRMTGLGMPASVRVHCEPGGGRRHERPIMHQRAFPPLQRRSPCDRCRMVLLIPIEA